MSDPFAVTEPGNIAVGDAALFSAVLPASVCVPPPPRFVFGTFPAPVADQYFRDEMLHSVGVYTGEDFRWSGGFVINANGDFVVGAPVHIHSYMAIELSAAARTSIASAPARRLAGTAAILVPPRTGYRIYGHWLVDILPKLAVLEAAGHDWKSLWYPLPKDVPEFGLDLMALFGIPKDRIVFVADGCAVTADIMLLPTSLRNGVRYSPLLGDAVALFRKGITQSGAASTCSGPARIFLARKGGNRLLRNRAQIKALAKASRFEIIQPETKSLAEQIALLSSAREITGEYGSAFHTAMFSAPGTVVCALRGAQFHPAFIQSGIGEVLGQPTGYVFGKPEGDPAKFDFSIAENIFSDCLNTVF